MNLQIDLKSFREDKLNIPTQAEFATLFGFPKANVCRWEKDGCNSMSVPDLLKILEKTGASLDELISVPKAVPTLLDIKDNRSEINKIRTELEFLLKRSSIQQKNLEAEAQSIYCKIHKEHLLPLMRKIQSCLSKPQIAIAGRYSSGKSSLLNNLLGSKKLPSSLTASTFIPVYIKHIEDMPNYIKEEKVEAWIFKGSNGTGKCWDSKRLSDEAYCREWKLAAGGAEILHSYGSIFGENAAKNAGAAVIFLDAPLLKTCEFVDLPGFIGIPEKDKPTIELMQHSDMVVYLSEAFRFMQLEDISILKQNLIKMHATDASKYLFILASKADLMEEKTTLAWRMFLQSEAERLASSLSLNPQNGIDSDDPKENYAWLKNCFYTYSTTNTALCETFHQALTNTLENAPHSYYQCQQRKIAEYIESRQKYLSKELSLLKAMETITEFVINNGTEKQILELFKQHSLDSFQEWQKKFWTKDSIAKLLFESNAQNSNNNQATAIRECVEIFCSSLEYMTHKKCICILKYYKNKLCDYIQEHEDTIHLQEAWLKDWLEPFIRRIALTIFPIQEMSETLRLSKTDSLDEPEICLKIAKRIDLTCRQTKFLDQFNKLITNYWDAIYAQYWQDVEEKHTERTDLQNLSIERNILENHIFPLYNDCIKLLCNTELK